MFAWKCPPFAIQKVAAEKQIAKYIVIQYMFSGTPE